MIVYGQTGIMTQVHRIPANSSNRHPGDDLLDQLCGLTDILVSLTMRNIQSLM
jgi:hypothetical protein